MKPYYSDQWLDVYQGDCRAVLAELHAESVHCVVTSPPYWGLRDYGDSGQLGLEATPEEYVANLVDVFREVRRVLRNDGTVWLNLGDSYAGYWGDKTAKREGRASSADTNGWTNGFNMNAKPDFHSAFDGSGIKPKDLVGIPWRVAFALQQPYYTGSIKDERDRIWLAAMLDAEGCMFLHKRKVGQSNGQGYVRKNDTYGAGMEIANTSLAIVERCMAIAGGRGSISRQDKDRRQPLYRWSMRSNECRDVVRELYPHLVAKQHQARLLLGCPSSGPDAEKAHAGLIELHGGGVPAIDFPAPASMFEPGWYVRSDVIWSKLNPMPESVTDRPTKAHEYLFLLSKSPRYYYDADAVREPPSANSDFGRPRPDEAMPSSFGNHRARLGNGSVGDPAGRNLRSVWTIATQPYPGAHFATFPRKLVEPCVKAGTSERGVCPECGAPWVRVVAVVRGERDDRGRTHSLKEQRNGKSPVPERGWESNRATAGWRPSCSHLPVVRRGPLQRVLQGAGGDGDGPTGDVALSGRNSLDSIPATVLDPFAGSGTTGLVAQHLNRRAILIDLNGDYLVQAMNRNRDIPLGLGA